MYLSRLVLEPRSRDVRQALGDCQAMHRLVMRGFPKSTSDAVSGRASFGVLYRVEPAQPGAAVTVLVQSRPEPDWGTLPDRALSRALSRNPDVKPLVPLLRALRSGMHLRFRLRANATKRVTSGERSQRVELWREDDLLSWLRRHLAAAGASLASVPLADDVVAVRVVTEAKLLGTRPGAGGTVRVTFGSALFDGRLAVDDPARFRSAIEQGLGSAKAYGFGLLSVAPLG